MKQVFFLSLAFFSGAIGPCVSSVRSLCLSGTDCFLCSPSELTAEVKEWGRTVAEQPLEMEETRRPVRGLPGVPSHFTLQQ